MISLLDNPDQLRDLKRDISLLDSAVEEILRFSPAVHSFAAPRPSLPNPGQEIPRTQS